MGTNETTAIKAGVASWIGGVVVWLANTYLPEAFIEANPIPDLLVVGAIAYLIARLTPADAKIPLTTIGGLALATMFLGGCALNQQTIITETFDEQGDLILRVTDKTDDKRIIMLHPDASQVFGADGTHLNVGIPIPGTGVSFGVMYSNGTFVRATPDADFEAQGGIEIDANDNVVRIERRLGVNQLYNEPADPDED